MGELSPVLLQMLGAGQIVAKYSCGPSEIVLLANVTRAAIRTLLTLVTHPITYWGLRFFLEGETYISIETSGDGPDNFFNNDHLLANVDEAIGRVLSRSNLKEPGWLSSATMLEISEIAVAEEIGAPLCRALDGWIHLHIGDKTVGVRLVQGLDEPLTFLNLADFTEDIVVVTFPEVATETVHFIGWTSQEVFKVQHRIERHAGSLRCAMPQDELFPMAALIELAKKTPLVPAQ
jgi:hypothetical protein